jgi:hypothetical protein
MSDVKHAEARPATGRRIEIPGYHPTQSVFFEGMTLENVKRYNEARKKLEGTSQFNSQTDVVRKITERNVKNEIEVNARAKSTVAICKRYHSWNTTGGVELGTPESKSPGLLSVDMADQLKVYREHVGKIACEGLEAFQTIAGTDHGKSFRNLLESQKSPELSAKVRILMNLAMTVHDFAESASRFSPVGHAGSVFEGMDQGALLKTQVDNTLARAETLQRDMLAQWEHSNVLLRQESLGDPRLVAHYFGNVHTKQAVQARNDFEQTCRELNPAFMDTHFPPVPEKKETPPAKTSKEDRGDGESESVKKKPEADTAPARPAKTSGSPDDEMVESTLPPVLTHFDAEVDLPVATGKRPSSPGPDSDSDDGVKTADSAGGKKIRRSDRLSSPPPPKAPAARKTARKGK